MMVSRKRAACFLALVLSAGLVAGAGWVLCIDSDGHIDLEQATQICCLGNRIGTQRAFPGAAESSGAREVSDYDSCIDLSLFGPMAVTTPASDAHALAWLRAQVFTGAALSPSVSEGILPSFPGPDCIQQSAPSQLFARTISLRC